MATTANTFPIMQADLKDQFAKDNKFKKVKEKLTSHVTPIKKCPKCGQYKCSCSEITKK